MGLESRPEDTATWSGSCPRGLKEGAGAVQWFEHGRPIDRFEGVFERGRRKGSAAITGLPASSSRVTTMPICRMDGAL